MNRWLNSGLLCLLALASVRADEAVLREGRRLNGQLRVIDGRWQFVPTKGDILNAGDLSEVRFTAAACPMLHAGLPMHLLLRDGQQLTAGLVEVDDKSVRMQSAAMGKLTVPRAAVVSLRQPPGWAIHDFRDRKFTGEATLTLDKTGQSAEFVLPKPLTEGRLSLSFLEDAADAHWSVEAVFQVERKTRLVSVQVGGDQTYQASVEAIKGEEQPVARSSGRHRLVIQFSPVSLRAGIDDAILWHTLKSGPDGPLTSIRLVCRETQRGKPARGRVVIDDLCLHRAVDEPRRPPGDPEQDEVWLLDGDQVFGKCLRADKQALTIEGRFGRRDLPWTLVRGLYSRRQESVVIPERERVRLWLDNGFDSQPDQLDGVVRSLDAQRLVLRHAELGELTLARGAIRRVVWPGNERR